MLGLYGKPFLAGTRSPHPWNPGGLSWDGGCRLHCASLPQGYYYADTTEGRAMFAREKPLSLKEVGLVDPTDR